MCNVHCVMCIVDVDGSLGMCLVRTHYWDRGKNAIPTHPRISILIYISDVRFTPRRPMQLYTPDADHTVYLYPPSTHHTMPSYTSIAYHTVHQYTRCTCWPLHRHQQEWSSQLWSSVWSWCSFCVVTAAVTATVTVAGINDNKPIRLLSSGLRLCVRMGVCTTRPSLVLHSTLPRSSKVYTGIGISIISRERGKLASPKFF